MEMEMEKYCGKNFYECYLMKSLFNNIDVYSALVDVSGIIIQSSDRLQKFYGKNIIGEKLSDLINHSSYEELRKMMLEVLFTNKQVQNDIKFNDKDYYRIIIFPIIDKENKVTHLVIGASNVTYSKKLEEENIELKRKLEENNTIKSIFLSNISHELRTPLTAIIGFSEMLQNKLNVQTNQKKQFLKSINSNAKHLDELLNNVLDYAKMESNEFDLLYENFSINDLFEELSEIFTDVNYKKNLDFVKLEFIKNDDKKIISDYLRLKQVLFNTISNSIKFTEKGYIRVSFEEEDDSIIFKIEDTGIGIPEDKVQYVFDRFWQNDSTSRKKHKGTGLGLSISKSIIEMFNGQIWINSTLGKGTKVFIKIPLEEKQDIVIVKPKEKISFSGKTIMIVDDTRSMKYSLLNIYLNSLYINTVFAIDEEDIIKIYRKQKNKIDLIIIESEFRSIDMLKLVKKLREIKNDIIIISKSYIEEKNKDIDYHLKKPFGKDKLISIFNEIWQK